MIFRIYSSLLYVFSVFFFPYMAVKLAIKGKSRAGLGQRLGFFDKGFFDPRGEKNIWVHAVSVGETLAAVPLVKALKARHPKALIFFSTVTETGNAVARENIGQDCRVFYFPFDFRAVVGNVVERLRPDIFAVVETEIWPNLLHELYKRNIPSVVVNGRISPRSFRGYSLAGFFMKQVLRLPARFNMQTAGDAERIKALGAPPERVAVTGNIKFDQACNPPGNGGRAVFTREGLGIPKDAVVFIAGSTHEGEEEEALKTYRLLLDDYPGAFLILAPRHPERLPGVEGLLRKEGLEYRLRSTLSGERLSGPSVVLLDTMGELASIYNVGDIVFVGGSWAAVGGHNVLEPAAFGKPVFFGPHMHNFSEISSILKDSGAGIEVADGEHLAREALRLLSEPRRMEALGRLAKENLLKNRGALDKNVSLIEGYLYG